MRIIDRYLLRQFLQTFFICYLSLTGVFIIFDSFSNLESFLKAAKGIQLLKLMGGYYACQSIFFFDRTSSLLVLLSAMFTVAWIQRHNEMTALMAAGISRIRVVRPVIWAAVIITFAAVLNREVLMPRFKEQLAQRPADLSGNVCEEMNPQYDYRTDVLIRGRQVIVDKKQIVNPDMLVPEDAEHASLREYGKAWVAEIATYQAANGDRPGGYLLDGVSKPLGLANKPSLSLYGNPVLITPHDRPDWLKPTQVFFVSDVTFDQLNGGVAFRRFASTGELIGALRNRALDFGADIRVLIHSRLVAPLLDITLLFLGLPLVVSRESRNVFVAMGLCIGLVGLFLIVGLGFEQMGDSFLISPALAAWGPLMLFVPAAVGMSDSMWER